ncbi:MAG: type I 3-dehydroquinate dehydratase [Arcanobacterium sp.]|nr:type I 3-dehydroquinate dehydratase [Arcanobacterium sp.]
MSIFTTTHAPALIVPLTGTTTEQIIDEAIAAQAAGADVLEWRVDFLIAAHQHLSFATIGKDVIAPILEQTEIPLLLTIRTQEQGGQVKLSPGRYRLLIAELLDTLVHLNADPQRIGVDLEFRFSETPALAAGAISWGCTVVVSHHDWLETPDSELMYLQFEEMLQIPNAVAKLAVTARSDEDVTRLLAVTEKVSADFQREIISLAMGEAGKRSRFEGAAHGSVATFVAVGAASAPGQPTMVEMKEFLTGDERFSRR